ncbi:MAG TPA: hypothetical protein DEP71_07375 [Porphyromonadaceae bacterium]|mgnify:CR=1 FL=1|nr:hypothetical protein [Porphyromonadaceae bacterium]
MTWNELKEFCNNLPEKELNKKVVLCREDESINNIDAGQLEEDYYIDSENPENGCFPEWVGKDIVSYDKDSYPNGMNDLKKVHDKGHPILSENF